MSFIQQGADWATVIGGNSKATALRSTSIGSASQATHNGSTAIGTGAATTTTNQVVLGTASDTVYIPGKLVVDNAVLLVLSKVSPSDSLIIALICSKEADTEDVP